jgi:hypothetical protein
MPKESPSDAHHLVIPFFRGILRLLSHSGAFHHSPAVARWAKISPFRYRSSRNDKAGKKFEFYTKFITLFVYYET